MRIWVLLGPGAENAADIPIAHPSRFRHVALNQGYQITLVVGCDPQGVVVEPALNGRFQLTENGLHLGGVQLQVGSPARRKKRLALGRHGGDGRGGGAECAFVVGHKGVSLTLSVASNVAIAHYNSNLQLLPLHPYRHLHPGQFYHRDTPGQPFQ